MLGPGPLVMRALKARLIAGVLLAAALGTGCHDSRVVTAPPADDRLTVVRRELEARYAENEAGFFARDPDRVMRLRHPDFHTITPDGKRHTREEMYQRTRDFIGRIERFESLTEKISSLKLDGDKACAVVDQRTVRQQRFPDGQLHEVRTSVVQRECWIKTADGWLMWEVDEVRPGATLVDGKPPS